VSRKGLSNDSFFDVSSLVPFCFSAQRIIPLGSLTVTDKTVTIVAKFRSQLTSSGAEKERQKQTQREREREKAALTVPEHPLESNKLQPGDCR
jgi:hypothetical protein